MRPMIADFHHLVVHLSQKVELHDLLNLQLIEVQSHGHPSRFGIRLAILSVRQTMTKNAAATNYPSPGGHHE